MRIPYFDFLKGVAIIMVVAIHCMSVAYKNTESVDFLCFFIRNLMNVAVPIFLSVSGFFVAKKSFESASDFIGYLKKQIPRVYFPVLFCSIPFAIAGIVKGRILSTLVMYFTCGYSIYYFIEVIIQCYLTVFLLNKKWAENYKLIYGSGFIAVFCWTVKVYAIDGYLHIDLPLVLYAGGIWMWYVFFAIGFFIGKMQVRRYSLRPFIWFTPVCFLLCVMESCLLNSQGKFAGLGQHPSSILFSVFFIPLLLSEKVQSLYSLCSSKCLKIFFTFVEFVGKFSFGIYLIHCFIISPLGSIVLFPGSYLRWVVLVLGDILLCMFCLGLMKKLFPKLTRILLGV